VEFKLSIPLISLCQYVSFCWCSDLSLQMPFFHHHSVIGCCIAVIYSVLWPSLSILSHQSLRRKTFSGRWPNNVFTIKLFFQFRLYICDIVLHALFSAIDSTYWPQTRQFFKNLLQNIGLLFITLFPILIYFPKKGTSFLIIYDPLDKFFVNIYFIPHIFRSIVYDGSLWETPRC
jgi:hypothetical protein